jgi:iron(III) transport system ATP-binding protein
VVVGPSGCGKTTLLRLIAGLDRPGAGVVSLGGRTLCDASGCLPPEERPVGMVFQGNALFPHLNVLDNVAFGLHGSPKKQRTERAMEEVRAVGLSGFEKRFPHELSGGQQQRVAIARSLVLRPRLLLMDEPFSDLDATTRRRIRTEVQQILHRHRTAAIIVSHDREDALQLADRVAEMDEGRFVRFLSAADLAEARGPIHVQL